MIIVPVFLPYVESVQVVFEPADDGVRLRYAESPELNRTLLIGPAAAASTAAVKNSGLALPGILMTRSAAR